MGDKKNIKLGNGELERSHGQEVEENDEKRD